MHYLSLQSWQPLGKGLLSVLVLLGLMLASRLSPPVLLDGVNLLVPVHIGLETLSIIVSVLIFSVSWSAGRQLRAHFMVLMGVLFLGVALLDFSHMLSFQGMPSPWPMMDGNLTIYFWLAARLLAALGLLLVALLPWRQSVRRVGAYAYLLGLLFLVACLHLVFIQFPGVLPAVFIPGEGLTFFKIATEYLIIVLHLATVALLLLSKEETHLFSVPHLVLALFIMIMSELFFTFYADLTDVYMLLGHLYKVIAYGLLYVVFVSRGIDAPYRALGEMKTRLQATVDALPDMMFELDREGLVVNFHSGYGRLLKDPGKFIGRRLADTVPEEVWEQGEQALADIDRQGYTEGRQYVLDMEDGEHWFEISGRYMPLNHELPHYLLLIRDITRRVHYQKELEKSQQFIQAALDHLPVGVALNTVGEEVRFRYMNERFASSFGTTRHVLETSEDFWEAVYPDPIQRHEVRSRVIEDVASGNPARMQWHEIPLRRPGEPTRYISAQNIPLPMENLMLSLVRDVTEEVNSRHELSIAAVAFQSLEGVMIVDAEQRILRVNEAFTRTTGYTEDEVRGLRPSVLQSGKHPRSFYEAMWTELSSKGLWRGEVWNRRKNGELYPQNLSITAVRNEAGEVTNYVANFIETSALKQAQDRITQLSHYDGLTGLYNRQHVLQALEEALVRAREKQQYGALLFIDLDQFKTVNDALGHDVGDELLIAAASRMRRVAHKDSILGRNGSDEFVLLSRLGVGFAIDDFGTGYSSLTYLSQLPVDELKIDQSFVANMMTEQDDASIVRAVIDVAGNLGKRVLAEGVETRAQWQQLQRLGCDLFQGYLFARPVPLDEFVPLVATVMPSETA